MGNKRALIYLAVLFLASVTVTTNAEVMSTSGDVTEVTSVPNAFEGGSEDNNNIRVFNERQRITLNTAFLVDFPNTGMVTTEADLFEARILVDRPVSSHLFHSDPAGNQLHSYSGCATFNEEIIGLMLLDKELDASDDEFGLPGVTYQVDDLRGIGFRTSSSSSFDELEVSSDRRTICLDLRTAFQVDQIRVITSTMGAEAVEFVNGAPPGFTGGSSNESDNGDNDDQNGDAFADSDNCGGLEASRFDIVPGNRDNVIHVDGLGKTPVALFSREDFDAPGCIDENTLTFGRTGNEDTFMACGAWDVNMDGLIDLQCDFITIDTEFMEDDVEGCMKGETVDGRAFTFCDEVSVELEHRFISKLCSVDAVKTLKMGMNFYFIAQGQGIESVKVDVFNMQGQRVFSSGFVSGNQLRWSLRNSETRLANGVYFFVVTAKGEGDSVSRSKIQKLALIR
jgi:hypothetical protein